MGDIIHALPAVSGLRAAFPEWQIDWAVEERWAPLLTARPATEFGTLAPFSTEQPLVNIVHAVHMRRWRDSPFDRRTYTEIAGLRKRLRELQYDAVIDLQGAIRSALLAKVSGARVRAGALHPRELPARWLYNVKAATPARHVVHQAAETVSAGVGQRIDPTCVSFPVFAEATQWAEKLHPDQSPFAMMNPGAGWGAKCWPAERYQELVRLLAKHGIRTLVNAGPGETELAARVCEGYRESATVVNCSLPQLITLTRRSSLFIGGDTGPLHLASALGVPVVAIFGPTDPARNGPYEGKYVVLRDPESKRDHSRRSAPEAGLLNISVGQVAEAALGLLGVPA
jgi:heptosyltransferase-1